MLLASFIAVGLAGLTHYGIFSRHVDARAIFTLSHACLIQPAPAADAMIFDVSHAAHGNIDTLTR